MALLPCYECKTEISTAAVACPKCGAPNKMRVQPSNAKEPAKTRPIFKILAAALVALFFFALFSDKDAPTPAAALSEPTIEADADKLFADYKENEVSADNKYKGKRVIVAGVVASINKDFKNTAWVGLRTSNQFMPIHAEGLGVEQVSKLKKGEVIAVTCTGAGMILGSPFLKDCK